MLETRCMEIGPEEEPIYVEPVEDPFSVPATPAETPTPAPVERPTPARTPVPEKVPA